MKPTSLIPLSLLLLMVACSQTSAPNDTLLSPQSVISLGSNCSLINAIHSANRDESVGGCSRGSLRDLIRLEAGRTYTLSEVDNITRGPNGLPVITSAITIEGNGATIERDDAPDTPQFRLFEVAREGDLILQEVTVRNGDTPDEGGGIYTAGHLTVENSTIAENRAEDDEYGGGGIHSSYTGRVVLRNSTVADNEGGGIYGSEVELYKSIVRGNLAGREYGIGTGIYMDQAGVLIVTESIIEENAGSGISSEFYGRINITMTKSTVRNNGGSGIYNSAGNTVIKNSTISGNGSSGIHADVGDWKIVSSTISGNRGFGIYNSGGNVNIKLSTITATIPLDVPRYGLSGGGIRYIEGGGRPSDRMTLYHSIVANQRGVPDCVGNPEYPSPPPISEGFNLDRDGSCGLTRSSDRPLTDPKLGPLQDNGGPTQTHALLPGSPAINAGERTLEVPFDQRGRGFPRVSGGAADLGAYEVSPAPITPPEPPASTLCGIPEGLWRLLGHSGLSLSPCQVILDPCFWQRCEASPFLELWPIAPCHACGWRLTLPRETSLRLNFRIDAFAKDPKAFAKAFAFGLYTSKGKLIRQGKLTEVIDPQTKKPYYALGLEANVSKGSYVVSVEVLDKKLWDVMSKAPKDYPFEFGFPNK